MIEVILIVVLLGGLEVVLWYKGRADTEKTHQLLEDILVTLVSNGDSHDTPKVP